ncbi:MAG: hypothetical protein LCH58_04635 [Bacteroidetes bacterium]|uniref:hypothetical protein n=1 Tax=Phnomibacter sp. TaxID=2836217 RepID=UPI002FDDB49F|nr:hypothetical protein [Bacteroidota bacterium]
MAATQYSKWLLTVIFTASFFAAKTQLYFDKEKIISPYTIQNEKAEKRKQRLIDQANSLNTLNIDSNDGELESALWAVGQFLVRTPQSDAGVARLMQQFGRLSSGNQRALMELVYGLYPNEFITEAKRIVQQTDHPKLFAQTASYLYRADASLQNWLLQLLPKRFPNYSSHDLLIALQQHLQKSNAATLPALDSLFAHQQLHKFKVVYSFQRSHRNAPGIAVVQQADGRFAKDEQGQLKSFVQLARSASNLPYFITNGSTPQGLYAITGTGISKNVFIGPTPNLQMVMMHEVNPPTFTHYFPIVFNAPPEKLYRSYFPANWQQWSGLMEAYQAGKIGRSEIIAHGTTIDPEWFKGQPYYPISPTLGCLCGREIWDPKTGKISNSDQLNLVNTFIETPGTKGYLIVINLDDKPGPVTPEEIAPIIERFEKTIQQ